MKNIRKRRRHPGRNVLLCLGLLLMGLVLGGMSVEAAEGTVTTKIPSFPVTLNGTKMDNAYSQYPLIVYNDITYFPMTWFDCRFLSVETDWQGNEKGLFIQRSDVRGGYTPYRGTTKNQTQNTATVVTFPVTVNGKTVDNTKEPYPLLNFRWVTYFPMTWRFCVDELGWEYHFDSKNGLVIRSGKDAVETMTALPEKNSISYSWDQVTSDGENAYYMDTKGQIIRMPLAKIQNGQTANKSDGAVMYQLPRNGYTDEYCQPLFYELYGHRYLWYNTGGGVMGSRYVVEMNASRFDEKSQNQSNYFDFGNGKEFSFWSGAAPGANNLERLAEGGVWHSVGDPKYIYGWDWEVDGESQGGSGTYSLYYDGGNYLYTLAFDMSDGQDIAQRRNGVYQIHLQTNETVRISPASERTRRFVVEDGKLYYEAGGRYYVYDTKTRNAELYASPSTPFDTFEVLGGVLYGVSGVDYTREDSVAILSRLDRNGTPTRIGEIVRWEAMSQKTDPDTGKRYLVVSCQDKGAAYLMVVLNEEGKIVLKNSDQIKPTNTTVKNGVLYYFNGHSDKMCKVTL